MTVHLHEPFSTASKRARRLIAEPRLKAQYLLKTLEVAPCEGERAQPRADRPPLCGAAVGRAMTVAPRGRYQAQGHEQAAQENRIR